jgi:hypothetical protein
LLTSGDFTIKLPRFDYVVQHNDYSGSFGAFRYKMYPDKKDEDNIIVAAVYRDRCYELEKEEGRVEEAQFPYSDEGVDQAEEWIMEKYKAFAAS